MQFLLKSNRGMSPERAGTPPEEEKVFTPKMSVPGSPVAGTPLREAQSAFSFLLAVAQSHGANNTNTTNNNNRSADDDLTSLSWLQDKDLLKGMNLVNPSPSNSTQTSPIKLSPGILSDRSPTSDYVDESSISAAESSGSSLNSPIPQSTPQGQKNQRYRHPHTIPYDPMVHITNKPPYSFSCLIFMAIEDSMKKALPVKEIYAWIIDHFPYFRTAPTGWKNSVRHNLSLNKCFQKVEKAPNLGKGSLWTVDQNYRPNLLQALTRSPFHPCSTLDPSDYSNNKKDKVTVTSVTRLPNPELFPYLSNEMSRLVKSEISDSESLDAADAAAVMLSLRNGPQHRMNRRNIVISNSPSQDHTYSVSGQIQTIKDEAFESDEERSPVCRRITFDNEEERRIKEGAETLLNLAGIDTRKRINSENTNELKRIKIEDEPPSSPPPPPPQRPIQFRPRLLRRKRELRKTNNNFIQSDNEWAKQRRELELAQAR